MNSRSIIISGNSSKISCSGKNSNISFMNNISLQNENIEI